MFLISCIIINNIAPLDYPISWLQILMDWNHQYGKQPQKYVTAKFLAIVSIRLLFTLDVKSDNLPQTQTKKIENSKLLIAIEWDPEISNDNTDLILVLYATSIYFGSWLKWLDDDIIT